MSSEDNKMYCQNCGLEINEFAGLAFENRSPCLKCGSKSRSFHITVIDTVTAHEMLGTKLKRPGKNKPYIEQKSGDDFHRDSKTWRKLERIIDRDNDLYKETISDPQTGEIYHQKDEPLSHHQGCGSAKLKKES